MSERRGAIAARGPEAGRAQISVLRVYHSAVVTGWRERDRQLRLGGFDVTLVSPRRWNEGGTDVRCQPGDDLFVHRVTTRGRHPYRFHYDTRPIAGLLRSRRFDIVDIHEEPASLAAAEIMRVTNRYQPEARVLLYSAQNLDKRFPMPFRWFEQRALRRASAVYCCNAAAGSILRRKGFTGIVEVFGLGVDVERFAPIDGVRHEERAAATAAGRAIVVGFVGRLEHRKGVGVLIDALARLDGVRLEIHGDGPDRPALETHVQSLGMGDKIVFRGYRTHDALPEMYRGFDILAVPSLPTPRWVEQFGRVVVEGMASGVPIVASDCGALPEVVGDAGVLAQPGDIAAWVGQLERLVASQSLRSDLAARGRLRARQYSWSAVAERHGALYRKVLA